jgi:hypothetical protein
LVIIDPLSAHLGDVNSHNDASMRGVLSPLSEWANRQGVAVLAIAHLNKGDGGKAVYRLNGSIATIAAARMGYGVLPHPDDDEADPARRRLLVPIKANIAQMPLPLVFTVEGADADGIETSRVVLGEAYTGSVDELWQPPPPPSRAQEEREECQLWVSGMLVKHGAIRLKCLAGEAEELYSEKQVRCALRAIQAKRHKVGFGSGACWLWVMPPAVVPGEPPPTLADQHQEPSGGGGDLPRLAVGSP